LNTIQDRKDSIGSDRVDGAEEGEEVDERLVELGRRLGLESSEEDREDRLRKWLHDRSAGC
jgi:hypothetical protein